MPWRLGLGDVIRVLELLVVVKVRKNKSKLSYHVCYLQ